MPRIVAPVLVAALIASQSAWAKDLLGTAGRDRLVGTAGADLVKPRGGPDTVTTGSGNDRVVAPADDAVDSIDCGAGTDLVLADLADRVMPTCEFVSRQLSRDRTTDFRAQHETAVEPHSFAYGQAVVVAFQLGRFEAGGGAASLGWSASRDSGRTWRTGVLATTGFRAVSDPVVAYDAAHATWLITYVALTGSSVDVFVSRSADGLAWGQPVPVAVAPSPDVDYDKEWIVCDNGAASRFRGRCYVSYLDTASRMIVTRASTDGGRTWAAPVGSRAGIPEGVLINGAMPVVRPNGDLVVLFTVFPMLGAGDWVASTRSTDGGVTFSPATRVSSIDAQDPLGMRAPPLVSAAADRSGAIRAVWSDCRFREQCESNDVVLATSRDGVSWAPPVVVPTTVSAARVDAMIPAIAVSGADLAVAYYTLPQPNGCAQFACPGLDAWTVAQRGGKWSRPQRISPQSMPLAWLADGGIGAMVGDYISVSWSGGTPIAVVALATEPETDALREAIFAAAPAAPTLK